MKTLCGRLGARLVSVLAVVVLPVSTEAATLLVQSTADGGGSCPGPTCTLRQAITHAAAGDTITFGLPPESTIGLTSGELSIDKDLRISGPGATQLKVQRSAASSTPLFRIFGIGNSAGEINVTISGLTIANGNAPTGENGGGVRVRERVSVVLVDSVVSGNTAAQAGGGVTIEAGGAASIVNTNVSGNSTANGAGGGVLNNGTVRVTNSTISGNLNSPLGGGVFNGSVAVITNSTLTGNSGGVRSIGLLTITQSTIAANSGYGIQIITGVAAVLRNTIVVANGSNDVSGNLDSAGYNLIGSGGGGDFNGPGDRVGVTAAELNLSALQDNGGPTLTLKPLTGSVAIDAAKIANDPSGQPVTTDQRGQPRPVDRNEPNVAGGDGTDIGAVESGSPQPGPTFTVTTTLERDEGGCTTDDCTLIEALNLTNAVADANTITFRPGLTGAIGTAALTPVGLTISNPVTINGPGARVLAVTGRTSARVFRVLSQNVNISGLAILNGKRSGENGGAIHNSGGLTLTDCLIENSQASGSANGGGVFNASAATLSLTRCSLNFNLAQNGGGLYNDGTVTATNCTFALNTALQAGGGIYSSFNNNASKVSLRSCTLAFSGSFGTGTGSGDGGGGFYAQGNAGQYDVGNSIIAGNSSNTSPPVNPDVRGNFTSAGHNLIGNVSFSTGFSNGVKGDQVGTPGAPKDARLDSPRNNGGPTDTVALTDSTARDAGDDALAPSTDQRGYLRSGRSDIGAFEFAGVPPLPPTVTTFAATNIGPTFATLNAGVDPNGISTTFQFTSSFGSFAVQNAGNGTSDVPFSMNVSGLTPNTTYRFNAVASSVAGSTQGAEQTFTTLPGTRFANIATRMRVETGENVLIGGFIVTGSSQKRLLLRAIGPSLPLDDRLQNPLLELYNASGELIGSNDNWNDAPNRQEIIDSTIPPSNDLESAILQNVNLGAHTAIVSGVDGGTGVGLVEVYDLGITQDAKLANISTRGRVQTGDNVMIGGLIVTGSTTQKVIVRAIGPSLAVGGRLEDPLLELFNGNGDPIAANNNWRDTQQADIEATTIPPSNDLESALVQTLAPGAYTAIVRGVSDTTGVGLVEVYALD
jgi:hypothetical protein